jgi:hypothetical protein
MSKGIPGCLLVITENAIKLRTSEEMTYVWANEYTGLILHIISLGNFSNNNEKAGSFLSSVFTKFLIMPNLICRYFALIFKMLQ